MKPLNMICRIGPASVCLAFALTQTSCRLPLTEVLSGMQRDSLIGYLSKTHEERLLAAEQHRSVQPTRPLTDMVATRSDQPTRLPVVIRGGLPVGVKVPGRAGFVYSPHTDTRKLVDVSDFPAGSEVLCPYTMRPFRTPMAEESRREHPMVVNTILPLRAAPSRIVAPRSTSKVEDKSTRTIDAGDTGGNPGLVISDVPYGKRVPDKKNLVYSPFAKKSQVVNVEGLAAGTKVRCPYTGKLFLVPPAAGTEIASKKPQKPKPEPKKVDKKPEGPAREPKPAAEKKETAPTKPATPEAARKKEISPVPSAPTAKWAKGKPGYVVSPYGNFLVEVKGKPAGAVERCPFSGKLFRVPSQ